MKVFLFFTLFCLFSLGVQANDITHAIGDTGYMIREAMFARASRYAPHKYAQALDLQFAAKQWMRGTQVKGRNVHKAVELTKQAYILAKEARDVALAARGLKVAY